MTLGYELEFYGANRRRFAESLNCPLLSRDTKCDYQKFNLKPETDITHKEHFNELISPVYEKREYCLKELKEKLIILKENGAYLKENSLNTGFHMHIGRQVIDTYEKYEILIKFLFAFQAEIYERACGDYDTLRENFYDSTSPLRYDEVLDGLEYFFISGQSYFTGKRECFRLINNTFELRHFNSSLNYETLKSYIDFGWNLGEKLEKGTLDKDCIDYYFEHQEKIGGNPKKERREKLCRMLELAN